MLLQPGTTLFNGKYRVEALVGQGASAEVYRVTHLALRQTRALKVLRRDASGVGSTEFGDYRQRFRLEAQLGAQIKHDNVIQVFDFEEQDDQLMLVMEYAVGGSLAERLARYRERGQLMPVDEAVGILLDAASGLAAVHAQDAVHRDLKPSNILLDANGHAKVADLGLAQMPGGPSQRSLTSAPLPHPGTAGYKSPEQEQSGVFLRPASDIYTLGLIAFELFTSRSYMSRRPGSRVSSLRTDVMPKLDDLVPRMLNDDPRQRPFDGAEIVDQLKSSGVAPTWNRDEAWQHQQSIVGANVSLAAKVEQAKNMVGDEQRAKEFVKHNQALPGVEKDNEAQYQVNNAKQASDYFISTRILAVIALIATIIMVIVVAPLFSAGRGISLLGRHVAEIGITTPQTGTRVYLNESLVVVGSAQGEGITRLDLLVDGKLNKSEFAPDTSNGADFLSISLGWPAESAGTHQLEVLAYTNFTGQPIARSEVITLEVRIP